MTSEFHVGCCEVPLDIVVSEIIPVLLLTVFLSAIPHPRRQLYEEGRVLLAIYGIATLFVIGRVLKPVLNLLKISPPH